MKYNFYMVLVGIVMSASACTTTIDSASLSTQFEFPNCDFKQIGPVEAKLPSRTHFLVGEDMTEANYRQLISAAMEKVKEKYPFDGPSYGLVDLIISSDVTNYFVGISTTQYRINATAIKAVQCGEQRGTWRPL